jgi:hypothetical protein
MSALTSLLVRDDAVSLRQIEDALQRQVLDGGDLDTALLEQAALPENVLIAYRAVSEHGRPASREEVMSASPETCALVPSELAFLLGVTPIFHDEAYLVVASHKTLSISEMSELAACSAREIECRITSELRVFAAHARFYGRPMPDRLAELLRHVDAQPAGELISVDALQMAPSKPINSQDFLPSFDESDDFESGLDAELPPSGNAVSDSPTRPLGGKLGKVSSPSLRRRTGSTQTLGSSAEDADPSTSGQLVKANVNATRARHTPVRLPQGPLSPDVTEEALNRADERDAVIEIYFRFARQYFDTTLLLSIKGERLRGAMAHNAVGLLDVEDVSVPIVRGSAAEDVMRSLLPRVADLSRRDEDRVLAQAVKRVSAQPSALVPVCIKRRVVSVLYGDRGGGPLTLDELGAVLALGTHVTRAFERIIHTRKALGLSSARPRVSRERDMQHAPTQRSIAPPLSHPAVPAPAGSHVSPMLPEAPNAVPSWMPSAYADAGLLAARAQEALASLGLGRPAPAPPEPRSHAFDREFDEEMSVRSSVQPPHDTLSGPARYLSKPPPGTGSYRSSAPRTGVEEANPAGRPAAARVRTPRADETQPLRTASRRPSSRATASSDEPPAFSSSSLATSPGIGGVGAIPVLAQPPAKPAPGTGKYRSRGATSELISVPPEPPTGRAHEAVPAPRPANDTALHARVPRTAEAAPANAPSATEGAIAAAFARSGVRVPDDDTLTQWRGGAAAQGSQRQAAGYAAHGGAASAAAVRVTHSGIGPEADELAWQNPAELVPAAAVQAEQFSGLAGAADSLRGAGGTLPGVHAEASFVAISRESPAAGAASAGSAAAAGSSEGRARAEMIVGKLCLRKPGEELNEIEELRALGDGGLTALLERFPGPLWFDRRRVYERVPAGRDVSALCRALDAFGVAALPRFAPLLGSAQVETRYYATLFACDHVHAVLLQPLLERLFDEDPQIRLLVRDVLPSYRRVPGFRALAEHLRTTALDSAALLRSRLAAIDAIAVLRDAASVPILIELIVNGDKQITVPAHRALVAITCQDFGKAAKKWRTWFDANAERHRVEWLIEGLMHADQGLRAAAGAELQKLTHVYYGYVAAAPKREREMAQKRYWDWWGSEGRKKVLSF